MMQKGKTVGQSLVEVLVVIGVTGAVLVSVATLVYVGLLASRTSRESNYATALMQDMGSAVRGMAAIDWRAMWGSNGLVGYWGMNEGADTRLYEPVFGNNGTLVNSPTWQTATNCKAGRCLSFNGTNNYVSIDNNISYSSNAFTVAAWVKPNNISTCRQTIVSSKENQSSGFVLAQPEGICNKIRLFANIGGVWQSVDTASTIATGTWYHVAGTYNGTTLTVYLNGTPTSATSSGTLSNASGPTTIGARNSNDQHYYNGIIDEVRIYDRALSASEIQALYAAPGGLYPKSFGGFWTVYEGAEDVSSSLFGTFQRWYTLEGVQRASLTDHTIVSSGGIPDASTVKVTYFVKTPSGKTISAVEYVTRSESRAAVQTDWSGGPNASGVYISATNVFASSTNINYASTTGQIRMTGPPYPSQAWLESAVYDTQKVGGVAFNSIMWRGTLGATTSVDLQVASSNNPSGPWTFVGSTCSTTTYYRDNPGIQQRLDPKCHTGHRYFRYKIILNSGGGATPVVDDVVLGWSP